MAGAYPCFCNKKQLRVLLLPPGWDVSLLQSYPPAVCRPYPFIHWAERDNVEQSYSAKLC